MIDTYFGLDRLDTSAAFFAAFAIGLGFGFFLERAGFGSSRRLAGIFYFRDMTVLKVMFTALLTALFGLAYLQALGVVSPESLYFMPTVAGAQIAGGLLFGVGFVMGGWCPGTAAVGLASGKTDALLFLVGTVIGSVVFNELFPAIRGLYQWGDRGVSLAHGALGMSKAGFAMLFTLVAIGCFWGSERIERKVSGTGSYLGTPFLKAFSLALVVAALGLFIFPGTPAAPALLPEPESAPVAASPSGPAAESVLLQTVDIGADHIEPEELADRLMNGDPALLVVDVRFPEEYARFHLRGAVNVPLPELPGFLAPRMNRGIVVLYSNGVIHPAQARDALFRLGHRNVYVLAEGLIGFVERCLRPASLRSEPLSPQAAARINARRGYFLASATVAGSPDKEPAEFAGVSLPGIVTTDWLAEHRGRQGLRILDSRPQPEYNRGHIPGAIRIDVESFRGVVGGVPSMLLPGRILAEHLSLMGIVPSDVVVLVSGDRPHDMTLLGMAFERVGHTRYAILDGGYQAWTRDGLPVDTKLPTVTASRYPAPPSEDAFTVDAERVLSLQRDHGAVIVDVRPADYYAGAKSDEARAGHVPGAVNRPYTEDLIEKDGTQVFKPLSELKSAYAELIPDQDSPVVVHCRTGHQASQTFFILKHLLGYRNVYWYDGGWTEWAARPELPVESSP